MTNELKRSLTVHLMKGKRVWRAGLDWTYEVSPNTGNLIVKHGENITLYNARVWKSVEVVDETDGAVV